MTFDIHYDKMDIVSPRTVLYLMCVYQIYFYKSTSVTMSLYLSQPRRPSVTVGRPCHISLGYTSTSVPLRLVTFPRP